MRSRTRDQLAAAAAVAATAALGTLGTDVRSRWYRRLDTPGWQPPGAAFGIVWTSLYVLLAGGSGRALAAAPAAERAAYERALGLNLALNAGWSWVFFRAHRPRLAVVEAGALAFSTADLARRTRRLDRPAGWALAPYAAWTAFATALSAGVARRNPG